MSRNVEEEDQNATSCPPAVVHRAVVGHVESTASLVETQPHWKLSLSGQFQKHRTASQAAIDYQQATVVDVGDQYASAETGDGNVTRNVHWNAAAARHQTLQVGHVEDALAAARPVDGGGSKAVQSNDGGRSAVVVDVEGAEAVFGVRAIAVADNKVRGR